MTPEFWTSAILTLIPLAGAIYAAVLARRASSESAKATEKVAELSRQVEEAKRQSEELRWLAGFQMPRRIDDVANLYAAIVDLQEYLMQCMSFVVAGSTADAILQQTDSMELKIHPVLRATGIAGIHIDEVTEDLIMQYVGGATTFLRQVSTLLREMGLNSQGIGFAYIHACLL
jgi:TnpA family transposase